MGHLQEDCNTTVYTDLSTIYGAMARDGVPPDQVGVFVYGLELWTEMMRIQRQRRRRAGQYKARRRTRPPKDVTG